MSNREQILHKKITEALHPEHLHVLNESHKHNVPVGSESHFKIIIVSSKFATLNRIDRHKLVHLVLEDDLKSGIHALSLNLYTPEEWRLKAGVAPKTPECLGNHKP